MKRRSIGAAELIEALFEEGLSYGVSLRVDERLAVARAVMVGHAGNAGTPVLKARFIQEAFRFKGLPEPPRGFAGAVVARVKRLAQLGPA